MKSNFIIHFIPTIMMVSFLRRMSLLAFLFSTFLFPYLIQAKDIHSDRWIIPGVRMGAISKDTSEKDLERIYGKENVKNGLLDVGEGERVAGTILFNGQPNDALWIIWRGKDRLTPKSAFIRGESSTWKTKEGITLGVSLKEIERKNGGPFLLTGFGWDYSGTLLSGNGKLKYLGHEDPHQGIQDRDLILRLKPSVEARQKWPKEYDQMQGHEEFPSKHRAMQKLNPRVYEITFEFE